MSRFKYFCLSVFALFLVVGPASVIQFFGVGTDRESAVNLFWLAGIAICSLLGIIYLIYISLTRLAYLGLPRFYILAPIASIALIGVATLIVLNDAAFIGRFGIGYKWLIWSGLVFLGMCYLLILIPGKDFVKHQIGLDKYADKMILRLSYLSGLIALVAGLGILALSFTSVTGFRADEETFLPCIAIGLVLLFCVRLFGSYKGSTRLWRKLPLMGWILHGDKDA